MPELLLIYSFTSEANVASLLVFQTNLYETSYWKYIGILSQIQIFGSYSLQYFLRSCGQNLSWQPVKNRSNF